MDKQELPALRDEEFIHAELFHVQFVLVVPLAAAPVTECLQHLQLGTDVNICVGGQSTKGI